MENAADALLMAFAVLVFVIALGLAFSSLAQAKSTADVVLFFSDKTNFQEPVELTAEEKETYAIGARIVDINTVIATIERCMKEKFTVYIYDDVNAEVGIDDPTYTFEYDVSKERGTEIAKQIKKEINDFLDAHKRDASTIYYSETCVEVTTSGHTYQGEDGTKLEEDVGKKIYITYKKN